MNKKILISFLLVFMVINLFIYGCNKKTSSEYEMHEKSSMIAYQISELNFVDKADILITENTALIGIDLKNTDNIDINSKNILRKEIKNIVSSIDPKIKNIFISSNESVIKKIAIISKNKDKGKKINLNREIKKIVSEIAPNV